MKIINDIYNKTILDRYGSRRGTLRTYKHKIKNAFGSYSDYKKINWDEIDRLVFVCKGNICRSAYAEAVAKELGINAVSCGIEAKENRSANPDAIEVASERGVDLNSHKTTPVKNLELGKTDLLVAMEPWQADYLRDNLNKGPKVTLLGLWVSSQRPHIVDPYGLSQTYFNNCFKYIEKSVHEIEKKIKRN